MTKETKDLGAAPPRSLTEAELDELQRDVIGWTGGNIQAAYAGTASGQILRTISELRRWRDEDAREAKYEAISERCTALERAQEQPAAQPPPDSSAALLEARRLLDRIKTHLHDGGPTGEWMQDCADVTGWLGPSCAATARGASLQEANQGAATL